MKCISAALLFFYMLNPYYLFAMNRVVQKEKKEVEMTTSKKTGSQTSSPEVAKKEINIHLPIVDVSVITPQPSATIEITSLSQAKQEDVSPKIDKQPEQINTAPQIKHSNDLSLDDEFITYNTLAETSAAQQENKNLENTQSVPANFVTYNPITSKTETSEYNYNNNSSGAIYGDQSSLGAESASSSSKIPVHYMLQFAAQLVKQKTELHSTEKKISLSPQDKEIIFKALYSAQDLKKEFERGTQERKSYNALIREINKVIDLLPAQEKTALVSELYGLNGYASDDENSEEFNYEKNFKAKDLIRLANNVTCAGISSQMQTIFDAVTALDKEIALLQEKKDKLSTDHNVLQNKHDHIEQISELFYSLEVKDHQALLLTKEETSQAVATLKNEITALEKLYANEKDAKNKVSLLSALNEKRKTASPEIAQKEKLIASLTMDITRMEKRLYPNQNNNNTSYLSLSGITNFFFGSKTAQPAIEDKK